MNKIVPWRKFFIPVFLIGILGIYSILPMKVLGSGNSVTETEALLQGVSQEEQAVLEELFVLLQEIEFNEREEIRLNEEIDGIQSQIHRIQQQRDRRQEEYHEKLHILEQVLLGYQRRGSISFLESILSAQDLSAMIRTVNLIRNFTNNVGELLHTLELEQQELAMQSNALEEQQVILEERKVELQLRLEADRLTKEEFELYLDNLKEKREDYEEYLASIDRSWNEIKLIFSNMVQEFTTLIETGAISMDDIDLSIGLSGIRARMYEESFQQILSEKIDLPTMLTLFGPDQISFEVPDQHLVLQGDFVIQDKTTLLFEVAEGSFYGMPLEDTAMEELFREEALSIDLKKLLGDQLLFDIVIETVEVGDGFLELILKPQLF